MKNWKRFLPDAGSRVVCGHLVRLLLRSGPQVRFSIATMPQQVFGSLEMTEYQNREGKHAGQTPSSVVCLLIRCHHLSVNRRTGAGDERYYPLVARQCMVSFLSIS